MKQKRPITLLLLCISILMLMVPVLPHHHHADGHFCMKTDQPVTCCHHTPDDGTPHHCCDDTCCLAAHFVQRTPQDYHVDFTPYYPWATLLYERMALHLKWTAVSSACPPSFYYIETLHGICLGGCQGLRAPPSLGC